MEASSSFALGLHWHWNVGKDWALGGFCPFPAVLAAFFSLGGQELSGVTKPPPPIIYRNIKG